MEYSWTPDVIPYAGLRTGHDQVAGYFKSFGEAVETTEFEPQTFFAQDDMVVVLGRYAFRVVGTGNAVDNNWVHTFKLTEGKISVFEGYEDSAAWSLRSQRNRIESRRRGRETALLRRRDSECVNQTSFLTFAVTFGRRSCCRVVPWPKGPISCPPPTG